MYLHGAVVRILGDVTRFANEGIMHASHTNKICSSSSLLTSSLKHAFPTYLGVACDTRSNGPNFFLFSGKFAK